MENKVRVGIYLRLSNEDRDKINKEDESESIKNQRNLLIDYINKHNEFVLIDEYIDEDLSGAGTYRPEFERLINDCKQHRLDVVLCKSQSRFSRDMEIVEKYINNKFKEWNIRFIGLSDNADTDNTGNKKARQINGLVNEWYLEDVSNNIRSAFNSKMKQGEYISPFAAYGYEIDKDDNNKLVIDRVAASIVKKIFNLYLNGYGYMKIAEYLNNNNISSPSYYKYQKGIKLNIVSNKARKEIKWNSNAIKKILTNELYIGNLVQGKRTTVSYKNHKIINKDKSLWIRKENTHEAIIDKDIFYRVQMIMKERTKPIKNSGIVHIFSGKVCCLECNHYMRKKNSNTHEYIVCENKTYGCINRLAIRYDVLENIILNEINKVINKYFDYKMIENYLKNKLLCKYKNELCALEISKLDNVNKLSKINGYMEKLYEDRVNEIINDNQFKDLFDGYDKKKKELNDDLVKIKNKINYYEDMMNKIDYRKIITKYNKIDKLNKIIVDQFIDKIYIGKIDKEDNARIIKIRWNY